MSIKKQVFFLTCLFLLQFLSSCKKDEVMTCNPSENFPFLEVGNKWEYDFEELFSFSENLEIEIEEVIEPGKLRIGYTTQSSFFPQDAIWFSCGEYISNLASVDADPEVNKYLLSDLSLGTTWTSTNNNIVGNYEVIEKNVNVSTPAGVFICDKITFFQDGTINVDTIYESPEFGRIKYDGFLFSYELRSKNF